MPAPKDIEGMWRELRTALQQMRQFMRNPFANSGISVTAPGEFVIDGKVTVTGDFEAQGKVSNDALVNPLQVGATTGGAQNFPVTTTWTKRVSEPITVPAGFSQALVMCFATTTALNSTAAADYLFIQAAVNGVTGGQSISFTQPGTLATTAVSIKTSALTGLAPGDVITAEGWVSVNTATWAANSLNTVQVNAFVVWLR